MRKYGLTIDQLLAVDLVTADGEFVKASEKENADLFWGVRGGGGNFGIVTEFEFRLNPVGPIVLAGPIFWPMEESPNVLRFYRDWIAEAPDELMTIVVHRKAPPLPVVPTELHGKPVVAVDLLLRGTGRGRGEGRAPAQGVRVPVLDLCEPKPFLDPSGDVRPQRSRTAGGTTSGPATSPSSPTRSSTSSSSTRLGSTSPLTAFPIWQLGGAVARVGEDDTAFNGRSAGHTFNINATTATSEGLRRGARVGRGASGRRSSRTTRAST